MYKPTSFKVNSLKASVLVSEKYVTSKISVFRRSYGSTIWKGLWQYANTGKVRPEYQCIRVPDARQAASKGQKSGH